MIKLYKSFIFVFTHFLKKERKEKKKEGSAYLAAYFCVQFDRYVTHKSIAGLCVPFSFFISSVVFSFFSLFPLRSITPSNDSLVRIAL